MSVVFEVMDEVAVVLDEATGVLTATWQRWENHETVKDCLNAQADLRVIRAERARQHQISSPAPAARD